MPAEVRGLHQAGRVCSGDPEELVRTTVLRHLTDACVQAGLTLGAYEQHALGALAGGENQAVCQVVIGLLTRAHVAGQTLRDGGT
jgi:hypothetical protein